jgi:hypothetical protein
MLLMGFAAFGQTSSSSYFFEETVDGIQFTQRINWEPMNGILRYEFVLDRQNEISGSYEEFRKETTESTSIDLSLSAGNYRYKVLGYNILNRLGAESEYLYFEVLQAVKPVISETKPPEVSLDDGNTRRVTLSGDHFDSNSEIYIVPLQENAVSSNADGILVPSSNVTYSDSGDTVELVFEEHNFQTDTFRVVVVNPGGLSASYEIEFEEPVEPVEVAEAEPAETEEVSVPEESEESTEQTESELIETEELAEADETAETEELSDPVEITEAEDSDPTAEPERVREPRPPLDWDLNLSLGYAPMIPFYPFKFFPFDLIPTEYHISNQLEKNFYPLGYIARVSFIPFKTGLGNFGFELSHFLNHVETDKDVYTIKTTIWGVGLSLIRQHPLLDGKLFVNARLGGGIASYSGMGIEYDDNASKSDTLSVFFPEAHLGFSVQYLFYKKAFAELGVDINFFLAGSMFTSYITPALTFGWQF